MERTSIVIPHIVYEYLDTRWECTSKSSLCLWRISLLVDMFLVSSTCITKTLISQKSTLSILQNLLIVLFRWYQLLAKNIWKGSLWYRRKLETWHAQNLESMVNFANSRETEFNGVLKKIKLKKQRKKPQNVCHCESLILANKSLFLSSLSCLPLYRVFLYNPFDILAIFCLIFHHSVIMSFLRSSLGPSRVKRGFPLSPNMSQAFILWPLYNHYSSILNVNYILNYW